MSAPTPPQSPRGRGRLPCCSYELAITVIALRRQGMTYGQICIALNARSIPTPMGRPMWSKSYVARLLRTRTSRTSSRSWRRLTRTLHPGEIPLV